MKITQTLLIISTVILLVACESKTDVKKSVQPKAPPTVETPGAPSQSDILQAEMNAINKAKNLEREIQAAKAERDRQDKETLGM